MKDYKLFSKNTRAFIYNLKANPIQRMLDFDFVCKKEKPSVAAVIHPGKTGFHKAFWGQKEILIPIYRSIEEATKNCPDADVMINFASFRSSYESSKKALEQKTIRTVVIIAEGISERDERELAHIAKKLKKWIIGPATVGGIAAGEFKIGNTAGTIENIIASKLYRPGSVGFVSKSGGMSNEMYNIISKTTNGVNEGIAIGGDAFPGSSLVDHLIRFENNPEIKMNVCLGELGGKDEYAIIEAKKNGKIKKPLVMWVTGTCAKVFPGEVQFGHAGAKSGKKDEGADAKNKALKDAGIIVPNSFDDFDQKIKETFSKLKIPEKKEEEVPKLPLDYKEAVKQGIVRKPTSFICTISNDTGEEATYGGIPISDVVNKGYSIGNVISILWFKKKLPEYAAKYIEMTILIAADHGPAVSGAHNAIVTARAGKDIVSSLCSGLLTIGPRFGGAIDDAARYFKQGYESGMTPEGFVNDMKKKGILIPGIGHRIKSVKNPDKRVELLKEYAKKNFKSTKYLDFALGVEKVTLKKADNLILNVDGCIGVSFLDLMDSCKVFTKEEFDKVVEIGYLNALFVLSRSIGFMGHILDQKRLKTGLYRHPTDDVLYLDRE